MGTAGAGATVDATRTAGEIEASTQDVDEEAGTVGAAGNNGLMDPSSEIADDAAATLAATGTVGVMGARCSAGAIAEATMDSATGSVEGPSDATPDLRVSIASRYFERFKIIQKAVIAQPQH